MSPRCAMPEHLNDKEEIDAAFPDDNQYGKFYRWIHKKTKTWFAFSFRCPFWPKGWKYPKTWIALGDDSPWRYEVDGQDDFYSHTYYDQTANVYLSRIQPYKRWSFVLQRPGIVTFHFYPKKADVLLLGEQISKSDGKVWFGYWNHFDGDLIYWMVVSLFLGRSFK